jgi:hypothetical protein
VGKIQEEKVTGIRARTDPCGQVCPVYPVCHREAEFFRILFILSGLKDSLIWASAMARLCGGRK